MGERSTYIAELEAKLADHDEIVRRLRVLANSSDARASNLAHAVLKGTVDG